MKLRLIYLSLLETEKRWKSNNINFEIGNHVDEQIICCPFK